MFILSDFLIKETKCGKFQVYILHYLGYSWRHRTSVSNYLLIILHVQRVGGFPTAQLPGLYILRPVSPLLPERSLSSRLSVACEPISGPAPLCRDTG